MKYISLWGKRVKPFYESYRVTTQCVVHNVYYTCILFGTSVENVTDKISGIARTTFTKARSRRIFHLRTIAPDPTSDPKMLQTPESFDYSRIRPYSALLKGRVESRPIANWFSPSSAAVEGFNCSLRTEKRPSPTKWVLLNR